MHRRALLLLVGAAVIVATMVVWIRYPSYSGYVVYLLLAWIVVSVSLNWSSRATARPATASAAPASGARAPLPSAPRVAAPASGASGTPGPIPFCIYCASDLPAGATRCPACGHAAPSLG